MSAEYEQKVKYLIDHMTFHSSKREAAEIILAIPGVEVTPPEPQWEPGQHARVGLDGSWVLGERHPANTGWLIPGDNGLFHDDEVTDVEPVAVLTAEDVRELRNNRGISNFERFFRERGLDL